MLESTDRKVALFGYEWGDGQNAMLWKTPSYFTKPGGQAGKELDEAFSSWQAKRREFYLEKLLLGHWLKVGDHGYTFHVQRQSGGILEESNIFHPQKTWPDKWILNKEILQINVGEYELDVFASREGVIHSGIEQSADRFDHRVYFKFIHLKRFD
jgi:hypothetical protein